MFGNIVAEIGQVTYTESKTVNSMDLADEQQLVEDAKTNSASFGKLYDHFFPKVYGFVMVKCSNRDDAEDLVSDIFLKVLENIHRYEDRGFPFAAWLFTIARNTLNNYYAKSSKNRTSELEENRYIVDEDKGGSPKKKAEQEELADRVKEVFNYLSEREMNVVHLKFFSQFSNREIMAVTGLSESNVAVILFRTLKKIKSDLQNFA